MATQDDVRRLALALPDVREDPDRFAFSVPNGGREKSLAWVWMERVVPKRPRQPRPDVLAVRVPSQDDKEALLASDGATFFTEPHYNGFPAVLVRLAAVDLAALEELLTDAWRCQAPRARVREFEEGAGR